MTEKLVIKGEDLQEAYSRIVTLHGEFDAATSRSDDAASAVGHDGLKAELENVASSWRIHRGKLLESLTDIESQIKGVLDTFGDVDDRMAQNLRGDGPSDSNPPPAPSNSTPPPNSASPAPSAPAPAAPQAPAAPEAPAPRQESHPSDVPETTPRQTLDPTGTSTDEPGLGDPNHVDITDFPPEMQNLLHKMKDLMSSPDFIARYPQFAAGASLGALLPLVMAGKFADSGVSGGGLESAREQVRHLLQGVKADAADGHMNVMTASDARAELERLLARADDQVDASAAAGQEGTADVASDPANPAPVSESPGEAPASEEHRPEPTPSGSSAAGGGSTAGNADWRQESPMQNENPASLAQPSADQPSGISPSGGDTSAAAAVAGSVGNAVTGSVGGASSVGEPAAAPSSPAAATHIPTPMMSTGSMTGGGMGQSVGTGSVSQPMSSTTSSSGGQTSTSSRNSDDKTTTDRRSSTTEDLRAEKDAK